MKQGRQDPGSSDPPQHGPSRTETTRAVDVSAGRARTRSPAGFRVTSRDLEIIRFLGRLRFASADQLARVCATSRHTLCHRLGRLCRAGLLQHEYILHGQPGVYLATRTGLGLAGSPLPPARVDLLGFRHDLAVVSLSLDLTAAHPGSRWLSERELRHTLGSQGGIGVREHVPDGVLLTPDGGRWAIELELTPKTSRRLGGILRFYVRTRDYVGVRYFLPSEAAVVRLARLFAPYPFLNAELWTVPQEAGGRA